LILANTTLFLKLPSPAMSRLRGGVDPRFRRAASRAAIDL